MARVVTNTPTGADEKAYDQVELASHLEPESAESLGLMSSGTTPLASGIARGRRWRLVGGAVLGVGVLATVAVAARRAFMPCTPASDDADPPSLMSLVEAYPEDLVNLAATPEVRDDALEKWLASANTASSAMGQPMDHEEVAQAAKAIQEAMSSEDTASAEKFVKRAIHRAVLHTQEKRRELKKFAASDHKSFLPLANASRDLAKKKNTPKQQAKVATCVFDATSLVRSVASLGANINDITQTCDDVDVSDYFNTKDAHTKVCVINIWMTVVVLLKLITSLSTTVNSCAMTILPEVDTMCAASVTGIITATAGLGGSATLMAASCSGHGWYSRIPAGVTPSNVGSNKRHFDKKAGLIPEDGRRLSEETASTLDMAINMSSFHAPPRQLLFGGGKGSMATHCATSIMGLAWAIAYLGLNINGAAAACPPKEGLAPKLGLKGGVFGKVFQNLCNVPISSAITSFLGIIVYIQYIVWQCSDEVNLAAICGSGATAFLASMSGISKAASGLYLACDVAQKPLFKTIINLVNKLGAGSSLGAETGNFGRRLLEEAKEKVEMGEWDAGVEQLKEQFSSPGEVWRSMGYDIEDKDADFRHGSPDKLTKEVLSLIEERAGATPSALGSIFQGGSQTCS